MFILLFQLYFAPERISGSDSEKTKKYFETWEPEHGFVLLPLKMQSFLSPAPVMGLTGMRIPCRHEVLGLLLCCGKPMLPIPEIVSCIMWDPKKCEKTRFLEKSALRALDSFMTNLFRKEKLEERGFKYVLRYDNKKYIFEEDEEKIEHFRRKHKAYEERLDLSSSALDSAKDQLRNFLINWYSLKIAALRMFLMCVDWTEGLMDKFPEIECELRANDEVGGALMLTAGLSSRGAKKACERINKMKQRILDKMPRLAIGQEISNCLGAAGQACSKSKGLVISDILGESEITEIIDGFLVGEANKHGLARTSLGLLWKSEMARVFGICMRVSLSGRTASLSVIDREVGKLPQAIMWNMSTCQRTKDLRECMDILVKNLTIGGQNLVQQIVAFRAEPKPEDIGRIMSVSGSSTQNMLPALQTQALNLFQDRFVQKSRVLRILSLAAILGKYEELARLFPEIEEELKAVDKQDIFMETLGVGKPFVPKYVAEFLHELNAMKERILKKGRKS